MTTPEPPAYDPAVAATTLAQNTGEQVLTLATDLAPIAVPFVLGLAALRWVLNKFGVGGNAGPLDAFERRAGLGRYTPAIGGWDESAGVYRCRGCGRGMEQGAGTRCDDCEYYAREESGY